MPDFDKIYKAYKANEMSRIHMAEYETAVRNGVVTLSEGQQLNDSLVSPLSIFIDAEDKLEGAITFQKLSKEAPILDLWTLQAYKDESMPREDRIQLEKDVQTGYWSLPEGETLGKTEGLGFFGSIKELATGEDRATPLSDSLRDWSEMPEVDVHAKAGLKTFIGALATGTDETVKIIKANSPDVTVRQDSKGNYILRSAIDGNEYAFKPGIQVSDLVRLPFIIAAFTPAGRSLTLGKQVLGAAVTQTAFETSQAALGGEFDPEMVPLAGAGAGAGFLAGKGLARAYNRFAGGVGKGKPPEGYTEVWHGGEKTIAPQKGKYTYFTDNKKAAQEFADFAGGEAGTAGKVNRAFIKIDNFAPEDVIKKEAMKLGYDFEEHGIASVFNKVLYPPKRVDALITRLKKMGYKGAKVTDFTPFDYDEITAYIPFDDFKLPEAVSTGAIAGTQTSEQLSQVTRKAAEGSTKATKILAEQAAPDAKVVEAAKRLGIDEFLQPDHVTTNQVYRELAQAVKSIPGSEARAAELQGYEAIFKRANDLIDEIGGTTDVSLLEKGVKARLRTIQAELDEAAEGLYKQVKEAIPPKTEVEATNLLNFIKNKADELGGAEFLTPMEQKLLKNMSPSKAPKEYTKLYSLKEGGKDVDPHFMDKQYSDEIFNAIEMLEDVDLDDLSRLAEFTAAAEKNAATYIKIQNPAKRADVLTAMAELDIAVPSPLSKGIADAETRSITEGLKKARAIETAEVASIDFLDPAYMSKSDIAILKQTLLDKGFDSVVQDAPAGVKNYLPLSDASIFKTKLPTYARMDDVRRKLTSARVKNQGEFKDADKGLIKKLEQELLKDQKIVAAEQGALETFELARKTVAIRKGVEDDLKSLFGKLIDDTMLRDLSQGVKRLAAGDISKFVKMIRAIPEDMRQEVVASGLETAFGKTARSGNLNFNSYANWYEGLLKNKQAYAALMTNLPKGARKQLSDLYRVSNSIRKASRERITTGRLNVITAEIRGADNLMGGIYDFAKRAGKSGAAREFVSTSVGLPGFGLVSGISSALSKKKSDVMRLADKLLNSSEFMTLVLEGTESAATKFSKTSLWKRFFKAIGEPRELTSPEQWLLKLYQTERQYEE